MRQEQISYIKQFWKDIENTAEQLEGVPMPELTREAFYLFQETGNRLVYENAYFGRRKYLTVYGMLSVYGERESDIAKLSEVILSICEEKFWALPAHVNFEAPDELTIDLFAAETAQALAELITLLAKKLPKVVIERARQEIHRRVFQPFLESEVPYSWWETDRCNWSAVCAGAIGIAAIYMELPEKETCIKRVCDALDCYLAGMEEDGACTEGLGYFSYGMSYYTAFAELLYQDSNGERNLMKHPKCEKIALFQQKCYFGGGVTVSFSDGSTREHFLPGLTAYLAAVYGGVKEPDYMLARPFDGDACYRWLTNDRNIRWLMKYGREGAEETPKASFELLPSAQWMICKDSSGNGIAVKGGHNEENHNHNDIGHFICAYEGELLLTDLGAGEYTREYFNEGRYRILCNRSLGHSVPVINGGEQCAGRAYQASAFDWNARTKELTVSFAGAYQKGSIEKITRKISFEEFPVKKELSVTDSFVPSENTTGIVENLITSFCPVVDKRNIIIEGKQGRCSIEVVNGNGDIPQIRIIPENHSNHAGMKETVYLIQWEVPFQNKQNVESRMAITFSKKVYNN